MGIAAEFFQNFDGSPTDIYWTDDFEKPAMQEKLFRLLHRAEHSSYIITGSVNNKMKDHFKQKEKYL
jgi:hypothetical protein